MILKSTDTGAPTLSGETGKLYDVLKWALPQLGWTIEFDNTADVIVFRNSAATGTGDYLRIDDNPANHDGTNAKTANVTSFASMSDIDTGTDKVGTSAWLIGKSRSASSATRPWVIVGDERYFWLAVDANDDGYYSEQYYGDIESDAPSDSGRFLTQAITSTDPGAFEKLTPINEYGNGIGGFSQLRYNVAGTVVGESAEYTKAINADGVVTDNGPGNDGTYPDPASSGIRVCDIQVLDSDGVRGRVRGAVRSLCDIFNVFANLNVISNQATARGLRNMTVVNRRARPTFPSTEGALMFDSTHTGDW